MSSVVRATDLLPEELEILRQNVEFAVANDGDAELPAVNRSLAIHDEGVDELVSPANSGRAA